MNELKRHKKSDKIKWIFTGVAFVLVFVMFAGLCMQLFAKDDKFKPSTWFTKKECVHIDENADGICDNCKKDMPTDDKKDEDGGAIVNESSGHGIKLMSARIATEDYAENDISPQAETAYTLTAEITPTDAVNKQVNWSVQFKNTSSTWATGKTVTEYVTVTPTSSGALTANVECKKAFSEQVIVTVTSDDNSSLYATCTVDYVKRLNGVSATCKKPDGTQTSYLGSSFEFDTLLTLTGIKYSWSDGTLTPELEYGTLMFEFSDSFQTFAGSNSHYLRTSNCTNVTTSADGFFEKFKINFSDACSLSSKGDFYNKFVNYGSGYVIDLYFSVNAKYNGKAIYNSVVTMPFRLDIYTCRTLVSGVSLNQSGLIF